MRGTCLALLLVCACAGDPVAGPQGPIGQQGPGERRGIQAKKGRRGSQVPMRAADIGRAIGSRALLRWT
jgi:hypothetical protein